MEHIHMKGKLPQVIKHCNVFGGAFRVHVLIVGVIDVLHY